MLLATTLRITNNYVFYFPQSDILHPLASLEWNECREPFVDIIGGQAVCLKDKVYVAKLVKCPRLEGTQLHI